MYSRRRRILPIENKILRFAQDDWLDSRRRRILPIENKILRCVQDDRLYSRRRGILHPRLRIRSFAALWRAGSLVALMRTSIHPLTRKVYSRALSPPSSFSNAAASSLQSARTRPSAAEKIGAFSSLFTAMRYVFSASPAICCTDPEIPNAR